MASETTPAAGRRENISIEPEDLGIDRPGLHPAAGSRPRNETFQDVLSRHIKRRSFLLGAAAVPVLMTQLPVFASGDAEAASADGLGFTPIAPSTVDRVVV